jgi:hypothetical protein
MLSRAVVVVLILMSSSVSAQPVQQEPLLGNVAKRSADIVELQEEKKCPEPVEGEGIVVCGEVDNGEDQLIFEDQRVKESSGASANANAAGCVPGTGCRTPPSGGVSFGKRRPPAIPLEEVYAGLPEPDLVVTEEEARADMPPTPAPK